MAAVLGRSPSFQQWADLTEDFSIPGNARRALDDWPPEPPRARRGPSTPGVLGPSWAQVAGRGPLPGRSARWRHLSGFVTRLGFLTPWAPEVINVFVDRPATEALRSLGIGCLALGRASRRR